MFIFVSCSSNRPQKEEMKSEIDSVVSEQCRPHALELMKFNNDLAKVFAVVHQDSLSFSKQALEFRANHCKNTEGLTRCGVEGESVMLCGTDGLKKIKSIQLMFLQGRRTCGLQVLPEVDSLYLNKLDSLLDIKGINEKH